MTMNPKDLDLNQIMEAAQAMQKNMEEAHSKLAETKFKGRADGYNIEITMTGAYQVVGDIKFDPSVMTKDPETLGSLTAQALRQVLQRIEEASKEQLSEFGGDLGALDTDEDD